jgi:hypothetical protein
MPAVSLVICVCRERELLERLLQHSDGCYDDLVVVHDGPESDREIPPPVDAPDLKMAMDYGERKADGSSPPFYRAPALPPQPGSTHELVLRYGGRYFEGPRCYQQEPHWPFAWWQAKHDWILRLDADEFPSEGLNKWLQEFSVAKRPAEGISGYTCIWPLWNGRRALAGSWPDGRNFFFHRRRVHFLGVVEMVPLADSGFEALPLVLHHVPTRKSYGYRNLLVRKQAYRWRRVIAASLLRPPEQLPRWRWQAREWPPPFAQMIRQPIRYALTCLFRYPPRALRVLIKHRLYSVLYAFAGSHWHHALTCWEYLRLKRRRARVT